MAANSRHMVVNRAVRAVLERIAAADGTDVDDTTWAIARPVFLDGLQFRLVVEGSADFLEVHLEVQDLRTGEKLSLEPDPSVRRAVRRVLKRLEEDLAARWSPSPADPDATEVVWAGDGGWLWGWQDTEGEPPKFSWALGV